MSVEPSKLAVDDGTSGYGENPITGEINDIERKKALKHKPNLFGSSRALSDSDYELIVAWKTQSLNGRKYAFCFFILTISQNFGYS